MRKIKAAENASRYLNKYFSERSWKDSEEGAESGVSVLGGAGGQEGYFYSLCEPLGEPHSQSTSPLRKQTFLLFVLELSLASVNKFLRFYTPSSGKVQWLGSRLVGGQILTSPTGCVCSGGGCGSPALAVPNSSPSFSPPLPSPTSPLPTGASQPMAVLGQDTHPSPLPHCCHPVWSQPQVRSVFLGAQHSELITASRHSCTHPHTLEPSLGSSPGPCPELAPGSSAPEAPPSLLHTSQFEGEVSSIKARPKEGRTCRMGGSPLCSRRFSHLADIQVLLQVIGVIELQDGPEHGPLLALPGDGHGR